MKTKNHGLGIVRVALLSIGLFFAGNLSAQCVISKNTVKDNAAIEADVGTLHSQKAKVTELRKKYKEDSRAGDKEMAVLDKKELTKARAELKKGRSFFMADVRDVKSDNRMSVRNMEKVIRQDKSDLRKANRDLKSAKKRGDDIATRAEESGVGSLERVLDNDKAKLACEKQKRIEERDFLKKEKKSLLDNGQQWVYFAGLQ